MTPLQKILFTKEVTTGCINETAMDANNGARNPLSSFFISCFTFSITPSINAAESSSDFLILIITSISSFKMKKVNPLPALAAPHPLIFLSNYFSFV